jgi:hypothetical protein
MHSNYVSLSSTDKEPISTIWMRMRKVSWLMSSCYSLSWKHSHLQRTLQNVLFESLVFLHVVCVMAELSVVPDDGSL